MFPAEKSMFSVLQTREERGALRKLSVVNDKTDFSSNDYLGFSASEILYHMVVENAKIKIIGRKKSFIVTFLCGLLPDISFRTIVI